MGPNENYGQGDYINLDLVNKLKGSKVSTETMRTSVDLSNNRVEEIDKLEGLENIFELNLSNNKLVQCPERLKVAYKLRALDLSCNSIRKQPEILTVGLSLLRSINFCNNYLTVFEKPKCYHQLRELLLSGNKLEVFPLWLLEEFYCLLTLDMSNNPLFYDTKAIRAPIASGENFRRVCTLDLHNTSMSEKHLTVLKYFPTVNKLDLGNHGNTWLNRISEIPADFLPPALVELGLRDLVLASFPDISQLKHLHCIDASYNPLASLPVSICLSLQLNKLILQKCSLYGLPDNFGNIQTLKYINLSHNDIPYLPPTFFKLCNLEYLDLYNNSMYEMPNLQGLANLKCLDLCQNEFTPNSVIEGNNYEDLKAGLRDTLKENRIDGMKECVFTEEDSVISTSEDEIYDSIEHIPNVNGPIVEESWDEDISTEDNFDPTGFHIKVRTNPTVDYSCLNPSISQCPQSIKDSPHFYHPGKDRLQTSFFLDRTICNQNDKIQNSYSIVPCKSKVEGQFDDF